MQTAENYLMISELQHFSFCRRQWALIHIEQQWAENLLTVQGKLLHEKAHSESTEKRGSKIISRSLHVCSHQLMLTGVCDVVEFDECTEGIPLHGHKGKYRVTPVEYKRGRPKQHNADALQLCAQAMCLEEMLCCSINMGYLFYGEPRRRTEVNFSAELRDEVQRLANEMQELHHRGHTPKVKPGSKCKSCSLQEICLPLLLEKKHASASDYIRKTLLSTAQDAGGER